MSEGIPYLGSKINLISKSEIRYEGILYTIDTNESTVALAKVRSFGTEDRPTDRPVSARDEVYEYIIFRGKDIKDIKVCEPPKPQPTLTGGLPNDPAIVQYSAQPASVPPGYPPADFGRQGFGPLGGAAPSYYGSSAIPAGLNATQQPYVSHGGSHPGSRSNTPTSLRKGSPTSDQAVQVSGVTGAPKPERKDTRRLSGGPQQQSQPQQQQQQPHHQQQSQRNSVPVNQQRQQPAARRGRGNRGGRGGSFAQPKEPQLKFDNEYDFEQANAEFKEMESQFAKTQISDTPQQNGEEGAKETKDPKDPASPSSPTTATPVVTASSTTGENDAEVIPPANATSTPTDNPAPTADDEIFYDKAKSFFDNISCEAVERSKGKVYRTDWRQERKLNAETFGVTNSYMRRGGYRGRGYRYNRGFRGGRRGGYFNNRGSFSNNREGFSNNREGFSNNREVFANNREGFSNNREGFSNNREGYGRGGGGGRDGGVRDGLVKDGGVSNTSHRGLTDDLRGPTKRTTSQGYESA